MRVAICILAAVSTGKACSVSAPADGRQRNPAVEIVRNADAIVRATAVEYAVPPGDPSIMTTGVPGARIRFRILETIRGSVQGDLNLPGYLVQADDFNDGEPPYSFVRPNGRRGSCFANSYRAGGQFLLMLKKMPTGEYSVNWYALGPVNEQLHSERDRWLQWVRSAADPGLNLPRDGEGRLPSPDGRYVLYGQHSDAAPQLWLEDTRSSERTLVLNVSGTARAAWAPDGSAFFANDRQASDTALAYIYDVPGLRRTDVRPLILPADPEAATIAKGHVYFEFEYWRGSQSATVRLHGHTDEPPVMCFDYRYEVTRTGQVDKLSRYVAPDTNRGCGE